MIRNLPFAILIDLPCYWQNLTSNCFFATISICEFRHVRLSTVFRKIHRIRHPQFNMFHLKVVLRRIHPIQSIQSTFSSIYSIIPQRIMTFPKSFQSSTTSKCIPISSNICSSLLYVLLSLS